ncbi:hypothetical protein HZA43_05425 [Candidatus Peregrinibacteria bacterium]|nr:hypothetical protein [Candidatus Peregrinibacteria bacterium]
MPTSIIQMLPFWLVLLLPYALRNSLRIKEVRIVHPPYEEYALIEPMPLSKNHILLHRVIVRYFYLSSMLRIALQGIVRMYFHRVSRHQGTRDTAV